MSVRLPQIAELRRIAERCGLDLSEEDLGSLRELMVGVFFSCAEVERLAGPAVEVEYPRRAGYRPASWDNPLGAWSWRCSLEGASDGLLAGKTVAIKDNIAVAKVPMMNGSRALAGYVPEADATVVTRILGAGAEIVGKAACEDLCLSGGSHTCATGPVRNPWDPTRSAGGTSSGSAALVANGDVDLALGGDQGGSIRIPSGWCGTVGLKPTYGLVPYTGAFPLEYTLDHLGPIARTVTDLAALLEVIAGRDGLDPRQPMDMRPAPYTQRLAQQPSGVKATIVTEGFGWPQLSQPDVDQAVCEAARILERAGVVVRDGSIPLHRRAIHIWNAIFVEGVTSTMMRGGAFTGGKAPTTSMLDYCVHGLRTQAQELSESVRLVWLLGEYLAEHYDGRYYVMGQQLAPLLRAAYDDAFADADLLVMPTLPVKAMSLPDPTTPWHEYMVQSRRTDVNTAPFNVTGHPAITLPCAKSDGLPIGMMLVGRRWEDARVLQVARAFEEQVGGFDHLLGVPGGRA
ncbi:MAG: amidase [Pseudonocardiaceae bacterium]